MVEDDSTIQRIRKARHEISEENQHDPQQLVEYYQELQKKYKERLPPTHDAPPTQ